MSTTPATDLSAEYPARRGLRLVASEPAAGYTAGGSAADRLAALTGALDRFVSVSLDELEEPSIEAEIATLELVRRRVEARTARAAHVLADRQARRAAQANPDDAVRARERARRELRNELAQRNGWSASEAKDNERLGEVLDRQPEIAAAAEDGSIPSANAVKMGRFLQRLSSKDRARVEERLRQAAQTQDPVTFARTIETLRGELNPDDAAKAERLRHSRRRASVTDTTDGMTRLYAELATLDGALVTRAIDTYRRMDVPGEHRRPEQRTADALVDVARAALRLAGDDPSPSDRDRGTDDRSASNREGDAGPATGEGDSTRPSRNRDATPTRNHGTRPHVVVTIPIDVLLEGAGMVDVDGKDVPFDAVKHLMDDAGWSFVVTKANTTPIVVTGESRTVSAALWRALVLRDGGCIHEICDAKPDWCDTMHLIDPYRDGGRLTLDNAGLGCRTHHRAYDNGMLELHWDDDKPVLRPRRRPSDTRAGPAP